MFYLYKLAGLLVEPLSLVLMGLAAAWILRRHRVLQKISVLSSIALLVILSSGFTGLWLIESLENRYPPTLHNPKPAPQYFVLLGGGVSPAAASNQASQLAVSGQRLLHAFRQMKRFPEATLIISAGNVYDNNLPSEAAASQQILKDWGIKGSRIIIEEKSRTTGENAKNTSVLLTARHYTGPVGLITSGYHMPRAMLEFRSRGLDVFPSSTNLIALGSPSTSPFAWLPTAAGLSLSTAAIHEFVGLMHANWKLWIQKRND